MSSVDNEPVYLLKSIALNLGGHFTVKIEGDNFVFTSTKSGTDYIKSKVEVSNAIAKNDVEWFDIDRQNFIEEFSEELRTVFYDNTRMMINPLCNDTDYINKLKKKNKLNHSITYNLVCENSSKYTVGEYISEGSYNLVYELKNMPDKVIRINKLDISHSDKEEEELTGLFLQSHMSKSSEHGGINCPYICKVYEFGYLYKGNDKYVYAIIEKMKYPLVKFNQYKVNLEVTKNIIMQILEGLKCLHVNKYVHLDIKEENIGIDLDGNAKILECRLARYMSDKQLHRTQPVMGTDIYAVGIMLDNITNNNTKSDTTPGGKSLNIGGTIIYSHVYKNDPDYNDLKRKMMEKDPNKRITAVIALNHPWFDSVFAQNALRIKESSDAVKLIEIMTPFIDMMHKSINHSTSQKANKWLSNVTKPNCNAIKYTDISTSLANFLSVVYRCFNGLDDDLKKQPVFTQINEILSHYKTSKNPLYDLTKLINDKLQSTQCKKTNDFITNLTNNALVYQSSSINEKQGDITNNINSIDPTNFSNIIKDYVDSVTNSITQSEKQLYQGGKPRRKKPSKTLRKRKQTLRKQTLRKSSYRKHRNI